MHRKKDYIIVKDRHPRISEVLNDCISLCVPTSNGESLASILQKICAKLTGALDAISVLEGDVEDLQADECPSISEDEGNIIECRNDGIFAEASESTSSKFGVSGEDDVAAESRLFTLDGTETFEISSAAYIAFNTTSGDENGSVIAQPSGPVSTWSNPVANQSAGFQANSTDARIYFDDALNYSRVITAPSSVTIIQTDTSSANYLNVLAINPVLAQLISQDVVTGIITNLNLDNTGAIQLQCNDSVNADLAAIDLTPLSLTATVGDGSDSSIMTMTPTVIQLTNTLGVYGFANIQEFADNASALGGGLIAGQIYRTGDDLKIVH